MAQRCRRRGARLGPRTHTQRVFGLTGLESRTPPQTNERVGPAVQSRCCCVVGPVGGVRGSGASLRPHERECSGLPVPTTGVATRPLPKDLRRRGGGGGHLWC